MISHGEVKHSLSASLWWNAKSKNTDLDSNVWQLWLRTIFILDHSEKLRGWLAGNKFPFFFFSFQKGKSVIMLELLWGFISQCVCLRSEFHDLVLLPLFRDRTCRFWCVWGRRTVWGLKQTNSHIYVAALWTFSRAFRWCRGKQRLWRVNGRRMSPVCGGLCLYMWVQPGVWVSEWNTLCIQANTEASP